MGPRALLPLVAGALLVCAALAVWGRRSPPSPEIPSSEARPGADGQHTAGAPPEYAPHEHERRGIPGDGTLPPRAEPSPRGLPVVRGRVHARSGEGLAGVDLRLLVAIAGEERELAAGRSAEDGAYRLEAMLGPALRAGEVPGLILSVSARAPGFRPARTAPRAWGGAWGELVLEDLALDRGPTVSGRCVDEAGQPLAGVQVLLLASEGPRGARGEPLHRAPDGSWTFAEGRTDAEGRFTLASPMGRPGELLARHERAGSARRAVPLRAQDQGDFDLGELALRGPGRITGHVRHPDGTPAVGFEVAALLADWSGTRPSLAEAEALARAAEARSGEGRLLASTRTRDDGAFELLGLRPGVFALFHPGSRTGRADPWPLAPTGRTDLELLAPHPRLVVEVRVGEGPAPGASLRLEDLAPRPGGPVPFPSPQQALGDAEGRASFDLAAAARVAVLATLPGHAPAEAAVELAAGEFERVLRLDLAPLPAPARLTARLLDPRDGSPLPTQAELRSRVTGLVHLRLGLVEEREVPPGSYRLELRPFQGAPGPLRFDLPEVLVHDVDLAAGESATIELPARLGGRLRLFLEAPPPPLGPELAPPPELTTQELERWRQSTLVEAGFQARVEGPEGPRTLLVPAESGQSGTRFLPDPRGVLSESVLPPGTHVLLLSSPPFRDVRASVVVEAGRVTDVHVPLVPR